MRLPDFIADVYGETPETFQTVLVYLEDKESGIVDARINIPLWFKPSDIHTDISEALKANNFKDKLGEVFWELVPSHTSRLKNKNYDSTRSIGNV